MTPTKQEIDQLIKSLLDDARANYEADQLWKEIAADFTELNEILDAQDYIKDKDFALSICKMLIGICLDRGMKEGSIAHKLGLRLYDFIDRNIK